MIIINLDIYDQFIYLLKLSFISYTTLLLMQNKINSSLYMVAAPLFFILYSIYLIWKNFSLEQVSNLWESIVEYKFRILFVVIIHLLIILWKILPNKKPKFLNLFFIRWKPIVTIAMLIYPFLPDFKQRFWVISENNVTDFYVIFLPIFIMFIVMSLRNTKDPDLLKEMKDNLSIKPNTNHKVDSLVIKYSKFVIFLGYSFLFLVITWWIYWIDKVNSNYKDIFITYPLSFFCFFLGVLRFFNMILDSKSDIKLPAKSNVVDSNKAKNDNKKDSDKSVKVSFK